MNQKLKTTALIFLSSIIYFTSCTIGEEPGPLASEERVISDFDGIKVETVGKVNLHIAQEYKVMIRTNVNVLDDITLSIYDGDLLIKLSGNHQKIDLLEFDVYAPEYTSIKLDGVADIRCDEFLTTPTLNVDQHGVGNIYLADIEVQVAYFKLHEVGDVEVHGIADKIIAIHSGVGNLRMFELSGRDGDLKLSGTGDIEINVSEILKIDLSGVGDIKYMGTPSMTINHHGIGKIINVK